MYPIVTLVRSTTAPIGTTGILIFKNFQCPTLELPWNNNIKSYSCIPDGKYLVRYTYSPRFKRKTFELMNVPNRGSIRIHSGNYAGDHRKGYQTHVEGCILLGRKLYANGGVHKNQWMIGTSKPTVMEFEKLMEGNPFEIKILWKHNPYKVET